MANKSKKGNSIFKSAIVQSMIVNPTVMDFGFALQQMHQYEAISQMDAKMARDFYKRKVKENESFKAIVTQSDSILLEDSKSFAKANNARKITPLLAEKGNSNSSKSKTVQVINLKGTMLSEGGLCTYGIDRTCKQMREAKINNDVDAVVLLTHSGGGEVTAAQRLYNDVVQAVKDKPVVMYVDGMAASGAYWVASACTEILMGGSTTQVGSIGVVWSVPKSILEFEENEMITIYATGSEAKHDVFKAAIRGDYEFIKSNSLNPIREEFVKAIAKHRPNVNGDKAFTGTMFQAKEAVKLNLVDRVVGSMDDAIKRAAFLARRNELKKSKSNAARAALALSTGNIN